MWSGIPIIHTLQNDYLGDQISLVRPSPALLLITTPRSAALLLITTRACSSPRAACGGGGGPSQVRGIMNGTTNFMLTKMEAGADYGEVLAEAQALGYAEGRSGSSQCSHRAPNPWGAWMRACWRSPC